MNGRAGFSTKCWRILRWAGLAAAAPALWACTSRQLEPPTIQPTATLGTTFTQKINNEIDILFMIDNSSSMTEMQQKLYDQLPVLMNALEMITPQPSLHVAVVSSDMGAPGDSTSSIGCTKVGDQGEFQSMPRGTCSATSLDSGANYIISDPGDMMTNYTDANIADVFQCIALLGEKGCGFEHQLASIDHALGSDNYQPDNNGNLVPTPPSTNTGFLRDEAYLGIVILTNEDDCSAPTNTQLFSLNVGGSNQQNLENALGPIANYRCNEYGHLCNDSNGNQIMPPLNPPNGATTLDLTNCVSNDTSTGLVTPVSQFVSDIKSLKPDPDNQILVAAITAPATPYTVAWVPEMGGENANGELWPQVEHSCGAAMSDDVNPEATMNPTDGSFGDPGVRIAQFVGSFQDSVLASICDDSYASSMAAIAAKLTALIKPPCITQTIQVDPTNNNDPVCSVIENVENSNVYQRNAIPYCGSNNNSAPCWSLMPGDAMTCPNGQQLNVNDPNGMTAQNANSTVNCSICLTGAKMIGCPCPSSGNLITNANDLKNCN
jgi:hypothetical protein